MLVSLLFLSLALLSAAADDAYTACSCVRNRLMKQPCARFVRDAVPQCAPSADREDCEQLCCESCLMYGDDWPVCRSAALRRLCEKHEDSQDKDSDDDDVVGPKMQKDSDTDKPAKEPKEPKQPKMKKKDEEEEEEEETVLPSPEDLLYNSYPEEALASQEPYYTPEVLPTPDGGEEILNATPMDEFQPTPVYDVDYPEATPEPAEPAGNDDPPFDATNEGELDLAPARGRPFAPAACECMSLGTGCSGVLAAASGVCKPGMHASQQGLDCHFACCRICIVNMFATYCDDQPIVQACGL